MPPNPPRCLAPSAHTCSPQFHQPCHFATDHFVGKTTDVTPPQSKRSSYATALRRFAYPCRYSDMIPRFGRSVSELSLIATEVTDHVFNTHGYLLNDLNQPWLHPNRLQEYATYLLPRGKSENHVQWP